MRAKKVIEFLTCAFTEGWSTMLKGPPGVGKTDCVIQAAAAAKCDLIIEHPVVADPTDPKGLPGIVDGKAEFLPFGNLRKMIEATKPTVVFLDDLGQAPAVVQAAYMQLILGRRINGHKVSDHVTFAAATNRREDKAGVTSILEPVKSRFVTIVDFTANVDDWSEWALANGVPAEVVAFVRFRPQLMLEPGSPTNDIVNRPSPRTITHLGKMFAKGWKDLEVLAGAAGEQFATEFIGFIKVYLELPSIDGILLNPKSSPVPTGLSALYAVTTAVAAKATTQNAGRIMQYLVRLPKEFTVLGACDIQRKCPAALNNPEFIKWAAANQEVFVG